MTSTILAKPTVPVFYRRTQGYERYPTLILAQAITLQPRQAKCADRLAAKGMLARDWRKLASVLESGARVRYSDASNNDEGLPMASWFLL